MANIETNSSDERICKLLESLKRVEPPSDFDFRVRARIAKGKPAVHAASWIPASLRVALPLVLLLVGGYFAFSFWSTTSELQVPVVADAQPMKVDQPQRPNTIIEFNPPADPSEVKLLQMDDKRVVSTANRPKSEPTFERTRPKTKAKEIATGGSFDEAVSETRRILPRGFDPNVRVTTTANTTGGSQVSAKQILSFIGIDAAFTSGWRVNSVSPNSIAGRSGIRAGDVIEAINGRALTESSSFESGFNGSNLRVRRGGDIVNLNLIN